MGRIGGRDALQAILDILLNRAGTEIMARMAATALMQPYGRRLHLDPRGRDRLLRRLAAIPASSVLVKYLLMALDNLPIRDGAEVIAELATTSEATLEVNQQAISVLRHVTDRRLLESLAKWIEGRPRELTVMWLKLAWERSLPIPLSWLKCRVNRSRSEIERDHLVRVLFQVLAYSDAATRITYEERVIVARYIQSSNLGIIPESDSDFEMAIREMAARISTAKSSDIKRDWLTVAVLGEELPSFGAWNDGLREMGFDIILDPSRPRSDDPLMIGAIAFGKSTSFGFEVAPLSEKADWFPLGIFQVRAPKWIARLEWREEEILQRASAQMASAAFAKVAQGVVFDRAGFHLETSSDAHLTAERLIAALT